jgi:hypothetical protein
MVLWENPLHIRKFDRIGTAVSLSSQGHPNSQMSHLFSFKFVKALVHLKLTAMLGVYFLFLVMLFLLEGMKGPKNIII